MNNKSAPLVSIILPVYNGESYLNESIESVLNQTYENFELLVINDGSTDNSKEIISSKKDKRIRYIESKKNRGIVKSLNRGLFGAKGELIARMDADDICFLDRIEKQVAFLNDNPEVDILGASVVSVDDVIGNQSTIHNSYSFSSNEIHKIRLLNRNTLNHPTVIFRKYKLREFNLCYDRNAFHAEDYKLWVDASINNLIINSINLPLLKYRIHQNQISNRHYVKQKHSTMLIQMSLGQYYFGNLKNFSPSLYFNVINKIALEKPEDLKSGDALCDEMLLKNKKEHFFESNKFEAFILDKKQQP